MTRFTALWQDIEDTSEALCSAEVSLFPSFIVGWQGVRRILARECPKALRFLDEAEASEPQLQKDLNPDLSRVLAARAAHEKATAALFQALRDNGSDLVSLLETVNTLGAERDDPFHKANELNRYIEMWSAWEAVTKVLKNRCPEGVEVLKIWWFKFLFTEIPEWSGRDKSSEKQAEGGFFLMCLCLEFKCELEDLDKRQCSHNM